MATVTRFEDLAVWRKAKDLANAVYALCRLPPLASDFGLRGQMQSQKPKKLSPPDEPSDLLPVSPVGSLVWPPTPSDPFDF